MKQPVYLIVTLMALCVAGIIGLQLFWNYQNYKSTVHAFQHDINQSLTMAVDLEMAQRRQLLIQQVKRWLADTAFIQITCDTQNQDSNTVFHINDRYPKFAGSSGLSFGLADFKPRLTRMTPAAKALVIDRFADRKLRTDLQTGLIYYYTQRLGDSLKTAFENSRLRMNALDSIYKNLLLAKNIHAGFHLQTGRRQSGTYLTHPVNASFRRPYGKEWVRAGFESPTSYFVKTMKWVILTTLFLVAISLFCFGYTAKTLLSQQKLARLKDDFINNMTHELNTPLASIRITAEALKSFHYSPEVQKNYLDIITYQTDKLTDLTARILTTNRLVAPTEEEWQAVDVSRLIEQAIGELQVQFHTQQVQVTYHPEAGPLFVYGRATGLLTVFTNLMDNALKYRSANPQLAIRLFIRNKRVEIGFSDNGIGIPAEYRTKIFEPFFRVPRGNVHDVKGYGLGLSYVRQVLIQHGGSIQVEANEPCGSLFRITLPLLSWSRPTSS